ncbi:MAG: 5-formyltetrahydrofolate cyclo-ligase [Oscillospiraceae bacterium]|jgi:5-formyltetrahydrofolate cyclo-ligase|nr:5-formyltetrahydrofolate cyclo-ligase [Oscillospiraceae bacterium]
MIGDIRDDKNEVRAQCKHWRRKLSIEEKAALDSRIFRRVTTLWSYREAKTLFTYVSGAVEVDTHEIIRSALAHGKQVAAPRCVPGTRDMGFCFIESEDDLEPGELGVLEPKSHCKAAEPTQETLCLVPGLAFDFSGARLGFGKGYYDRFLARFPGNLAGLCYEGCLRPRVPCGRFDQRVAVVITEKRVLRTQEA